MKFNHIPIQTPIIETAHYDNKHFYSINGEKFPSITTILHSFPNPSIEAWKKRTSNWEDIQNESFKVGNLLHGIIERYLKNEKLTDDDSFYLFNNLKPELDKIDNIQAQETRLYHKDLKIAGTVDLIGEYDGILSVCDFKNSRKAKKDWMFKKSGYYEQVTSYALMYEYCTGIKIDQGVILSANWDGSTSVKKFIIDDYIDNVENIVELYYRQNQIL